MEALTLGVRPLADSTASMRDENALRDALERDGYLFIRGLVAPERVARLRRLVLEHANGMRWLDSALPADAARVRDGVRVGDYEHADWLALQARAQTSDELWAVGDAPEVHRVLAAAFGRSSYLFLGLNSCRAVSPHPELAARPHQDAHYVGLADEFATVWLPLGDCPAALGPLAVWPGSHRLGLRAHRGIGIVDGGIDVGDDAEWHSGDFACGDALILTRYTIHRARPNVSAETLRLSADLRYGFRSRHAA
jgi:ectoine hydroxylase-related dioxygenase (phytanoyl-CoA dioxygenase family)